MIQWVTCCIFLICLGQISCLYKVPKQRVKIFRNGLEVAIPHRDGMDFVFFTVICNNESDFSAGIKENYRWTYKNSKVELKLGETFTYSIAVRIHKWHSYSGNVNYAVTGYDDTPQYAIPFPKIEVYGKEYEISIPHENGIEYIAFSDYPNSDGISPFAVVTWKMFNLSNTNDRWIVKGSFTELKVGTLLYCSILLSRNGEDYYERRAFKISKVLEGRAPNQYCKIRQKVEKIA